jgi:AraC-like DNA-binding protein
MGNAYPPMDMVCGLLFPMRSTAFAMVSFYRYSQSTRSEIQEKRYPSHAINVTIGGAWEFRTTGGPVGIEPGIVTAGCVGDSYGCSHDQTRPNSNYVAGLSDAAVDPDVSLLFGRRIQRMPELIPLLERAVRCESDDDFDSQVFEAVDLVSRSSFDRGRRDISASLRIQRVKRFIECYATDDITLQDMAAQVRLSPFVLLRQFKEATGTTPYAHLAGLRISRAQELLRKSRVPVEEIANRLGFKDPDYFARFFKKNIGITPTQYRKQTA